MSIVTSNNITSYISSINFSQTAVCFDQFTYSSIPVYVYAYSTQKPNVSGGSNTLNLSLSLSADPTASATTVNNAIIAAYNSTISQITVLISLT